MGESIESVLVADDDELLLSAFRSYLRGRGIAVHTATNRAEALTLARRHQPQVAFVDLQLGFDSGLDLVRDLQETLPKTRVFLITGYGSVRSAVDAMRLGAVDVLTKPFHVSEVLKQLDPSWQAEVPGRVETPSAEQALWEHVHRVLQDCGGNKSEASRRLKKPRSWLRRFLSKPAPSSRRRIEHDQDAQV
jgi:two-component system, response regulator RegA